MNNSGINRKSTKLGNNNIIPSGKHQISKIGKINTSSLLNKGKITYSKLKK